MEELKKKMEDLRKEKWKQIENLMVQQESDPDVLKINEIYIFSQERQTVIDAFKTLFHGSSSRRQTFDGVMLFKDSDCVVTQKQAENGHLRIQVGAKKISIDEVVWRLFHADWKTLLKIATERKSVEKTCGNPQCIWPKHFKLTNKKKFEENPPEHLTVEVPASITLEELTKLMSFDLKDEKLSFNVTTSSLSVSLKIEEEKRSGN